MQTAQAWLVTGANGSGKAEFLKMLAGQEQIIPNCADLTEKTENGIFFNFFKDSAEIVSLERAASLIEEERANDESEYIEGGIDKGRSGRFFLTQALTGKNLKKGEPLPQESQTLDTNKFVQLCGINKILDRGLKYMSTGEIRRTLLCHALLTQKKLLILSDPFAGLDAGSRTILLNFFNEIVKSQLSENPSTKDSSLPVIILAMERYSEIPPAITDVLEFSGGAVSFCGKKAEYEAVLEQRKANAGTTLQAERQAFSEEVSTLNEQSLDLSTDELHSQKSKIPLVQMKNVTVGWDGHTVLDHLTWTLNKGEHWLIRGPNGSGKTTFLELITGDNMQVFCNDVSLFGNRRGSGETVWEIKAKLGIVSYRMHVEYRMLGGTDLESVIISGFHDSIGLYEQKSDVEIVAAQKWLKLGGFAGREKDTFSSLSYGEQRALLILRAAVKCPSILILDEPCHGLDENFREKVLNLLETIAESGTTTLLHVTHDPTEVLPCERHILELCPDNNPMYKILTK